MCEQAMVSLLSSPNFLYLATSVTSIMLKPDRNLPNETLAHIFNLLSQHDLTKLALVSHRFNAQAKRVLYSSIDIADDLTENSVPKRTLGWCDAMKRNQLYDVPRKLSIRWKIYVEKSNALFRSCSLVNDNIRHLTLLDVLELSMYNENTKFAMELMIRDLHLPNLRHCSLYASNPDWHIHPFIASHPGLRYLAVLVISEPAMKLVPHDAVPELSIFYGTASEASLILPGRPVHHLLLAYGEGRGLSNKNISRMALTSVPLRILDLAPLCISPSVLRDIAAHLPAIEILRVHLMPDWTLTGNASRPYFHLFDQESTFCILS